MKFKTPDGYKEVRVVPDKEMSRVSGSGVYKFFETDKFLYINERSVKLETSRYPVTKNDAILDLCIEYRNLEEKEGGKTVWDKILEDRLRKQNPNLDITSNS